MLETQHVYGEDINLSTKKKINLTNTYFNNKDFEMKDHRTPVTVSTRKDIQLICTFIAYTERRLIIIPFMWDIIFS